jgi:hypothetical protein
VLWKSSRLALKARGKILLTHQRAHAEWVGVIGHDVGVELAAIPLHHTGDLFATSYDVLHASSGPNLGTGLCGQSRQLFGDAAHPTLHNHPCAVRAWQAAHVMPQKIH